MSAPRGGAAAGARAAGDEEVSAAGAAGPRAPG
jgi:hypothetical protein